MFYKTKATARRTSNSATVTPQNDGLSELDISFDVQWTLVDFGFSHCDDPTGVGYVYYAVVGVINTFLTTATTSFWSHISLENHI